MLPGKHAAGSQYVLSAGSSYRGRETAVVQPLLEVLDYHRSRSLIREIRYLMETYQVHTAFQPLEHPYQRISMCLRIIESGKHRILEADSPLTGKII